MTTRFATIDEYISSFPEDVEPVLEEVRRTIRKAVPAAGERISYHMPTITLDGKDVVCFAAWKHTSPSTRCPPWMRLSSATSRHTGRPRARRDSRSGGPFRTTSSSGL